MMKRMIGLLILLLSVYTVAQTPEAPKPEATLKVGMPAPPLKVLKWIKGTPVPEFKPGQVYVVEGWATWCGPCKRSIPHLSELAKTYKDKVTVIGVSVWERSKEKTNEGLLAQVEPFVEKMGDQMAYTVAVDDVNQTMANTWLRAAKVRGIPAAFIVDGNQKIAWMGHPMKMDEVLPKILSGQFDVAAEAERQEKERLDKEAMQKWVAPINAAYRAKDYPALLKAIDEAVTARPDMEEGLLAVKLDTLVRTDAPAALTYLKTAFDQEFFKKYPMAAYQAGAVFSRHAATLDQAYPEMVGKVLEQALTVEKENPHLLQASQARALYRSGQLDKAIEVLQKAVNAAEPLLEQGKVEASWLDRQKECLAEYQKEKQP